MPVMVEQHYEDSVMFQSESDDEDEPVEYGDQVMFASSSDSEDACGPSARMQNQASSRWSRDEQLDGPDSSDTETDTEVPQPG